jgi:hypothetical protein
MSCAPEGTTIFAMYPSSMDSSAMVALSVSMSAMTSPAETLAPCLNLPLRDAALRHRRGQRGHGDLLERRVCGGTA